MRRWQGHDRAAGPYDRTGSGAHPDPGPLLLQAAHPLAQPDPVAEQLGDGTRGAGRAPGEPPVLGTVPGLHELLVTSRGPYVEQHVEQ